MSNAQLYRCPMDMLVSTEWLHANLDAPDLVVLDCSVRTEPDANGKPVNISGREAYQHEHIPKAGFADLKGELCDLDSEIEFALPIPEAFCSAMGRLGVGDDSRVVLYDNFLSAWAARVWWMLRWVGFERAAILNGGLRAWVTEGRPLSTAPALCPERRLSVNLHPELIADRQDVRSAIDDTSTCLIDALPGQFYSGEKTICARPGHIPTAINLSGVDLIAETGHYKPLEVLADMHEGYDRDKRNITYCGGGILASSNAFVMTMLGFRNVAVYTASLQEWAADPDNPMTLS